MNSLHTFTWSWILKMILLYHNIQGLIKLRKLMQVLAPVYGSTPPSGFNILNNHLFISSLSVLSVILKSLRNIQLKPKCHSCWVQLKLTFLMVFVCTKPSSRFSSATYRESLTYGSLKRKKEKRQKHIRP